MRIVIDMQGAQTESRFRGIGRYTSSLAHAIVRNRREHEVILALSGLFPETIEPIRAAFDGFLPQENIRIWYAPGPVREIDPGCRTRREAAELIREAFLSSLRPDVIHVSSLFEGYIDDAVTSIGRFDTGTPVSVSLYDLIPLLNPDYYLKPNPGYEEYYLRKVDHLKKASIFLAISEFSRQEAEEHLGVLGGHFVNVSTAIEPHFKPIHIEEENAGRLRTKFGLTRPFVLYAGGADERKNLPRLIQAFAGLPGCLRDRYQLLVAGKISEGELAHLWHVAKSAGLQPDELCFSGYVSDDELVQLNNLCDLFVFPSWHEGFGLPALEAMACGTPVIGANTSSLPEVIGLSAALFDPFDVSSIVAKMAHALEDESFRSALRAHGVQQAKQFSWDESAKRAISAFELLMASKRSPIGNELPQGRKPRLAFVSPLPPERTGIADYSAELLPALAEHYDIEVVVAQTTVNDSWVNRHCEVRDVQWLRAHANEVDRVVYQLGNSPFHEHMLPLIQDVPGAVVLHDFYMSGLMAWQEIHANFDRAWTEALYEAHGYGALRDRYRDPESAKLKYPVNLRVLQHAKGVIVHSAFSRKLSDQWYGDSLQVNWEVIPLLRSLAAGCDKARARAALGIDQEDFVICSFGYLDSTKLNHRLLDAWLGSALVSDNRCKLIFVGENHGGDYGAKLLQTIRDGKLGERVRITGFAAQDVFRRYLEAADMAVQLRTCSRGETSAAVLDCMNYGLPLIVNANGSMAELDRDAVLMLPDEFENEALTEAIEALWGNANDRYSMGQRAREIIRNRHAPAICAKRYAEAIERFYDRTRTSTSNLIRAIAEQRDFNPDDTYIRQLAGAISATLPPPRPAKRLLLDVSATCRNDLKTGIERVARALLVALLDAPPQGYRVEPVYLSDVGGEWRYQYARRYTLELMGCSADVLDDDVVEPECGDVLLALDLSGDLLFHADRAGVIANFRNRGVLAYATVFDLLPVQMPEVFPPGAEQSHSRWLQVVSRLDGAVCISKAVASDLAVWAGDMHKGLLHRRPFRISWFHLGADVANSAPTRGLPDDGKCTLMKLGARPTFLMVGTIEPRKAYLQALKAFSQLWSEGGDINLVIVGREGWKGLPDDMRRNIPETIELLETHHELQNRLFWLNGVSDEYLECIYAASSCLIASSYGEGFGLPLIEAARHELPIIARDIPVFREVACDHAYYFQGFSGEDMALAVRDWLRLYSEGRHPRSRHMPRLTWKESAEQLTRAILESPSEVLAA